MVLRLSDSWLNWNLEMLVFEKERKTGVSREKPLGAKERTNNKLNPHMERKRHQSRNKNYFFCNLTVISSKYMTDFVLPVCLYCIMLLFVIVVFK